MDVDIHNLRYKGSTNALQNPELVINDVDTEDAVGYRLKVQMTESTTHSNEKHIKIIPDTGIYFVASALRLKFMFWSVCHFTVYSKVLQSYSNTISTVNSTL